jgi:hypothetical protein
VDDNSLKGSVSDLPGKLRNSSLRCWMRAHVPFAEEIGNFVLVALPRKRY